MAYLKSKNHKEAVDGLIVEELNDIDFLLRGMDIHSLGKLIPVMLSDMDISLERYAAHVPSLEDIFLEVTNHA
jgi:hypothetical protein